MTVPATDERWKVHFVPGWAWCWMRGLAQRLASLLAGYAFVSGHEFFELDRTLHDNRPLFVCRRCGAVSVDFIDAKRREWRICEDTAAHAHSEYERRVRVGWTEDYNAAAERQYGGAR